MNTLIWLSVGLLVLGQADAAPSEAELKEVLFPFYAREAADYEFFLDARHEQKLQVYKKPVMTWTNADHYMGAVFVWTYGGRPEIIGCIGSQQRREGASMIFHEFHSLSRQPLQAVRFGRGKQEWTPSRPGIELLVVDGAPAPSDSERLRLTQMRNIAREFNGSMKDNDDDVTELRLLPQPIFRYKAPDRGAVDGAIFAFVWKGTDPEVLLLLEDRKVDDRKADSDYQWHFGLARFNYREMWVKRNDKELWRVPVNRENNVYITGEVGLTTLDEIRASAPPAEPPAKTASPK